jgi:hypothetical protein
MIRRETVKEEMAQARIASDQPLAENSGRVNPRLHGPYGEVPLKIAKSDKIIDF